MDCFQALEKERHRNKEKGGGRGENTPLYVQRGRDAILHYKLLQYITSLGIHPTFIHETSQSFI